MRELNRKYVSNINNFVINRKLLTKLKRIWRTVTEFQTIKSTLRPPSLLTWTTLRILEQHLNLHLDRRFTQIFTKICPKRKLHKANALEINFGV